MMSKAVGIRELKTHLSRYVKEVKDGDEILVSDRGKIVARIVPVGGTSEGTRLQNMLLKLSAEGKIILPRNEEPRSPESLRDEVSYRKELLFPYSLANPAASCEECARYPIHKKAASPGRRKKVRGTPFSDAILKGRR